MAGNTTLFMNPLTLLRSGIMSNILQSGLPWNGITGMARSQGGLGQAHSILEETENLLLYVRN